MYITEVAHMAQIKQQMCQHLRSAKEWLTKAEDAFDKEHTVRAELDLMLAQAELQHATEFNRSRQWRYKYIILRHGLALTLAMSMILAIGGAYWWTTRPIIGVPVPLTVQVNVPAEVMPTVETGITPKTIPLSMQTDNPMPVGQITKETEKEKEIAHPATVIQTNQPKQQPHYQAPVVLSDDEVQRMVRAAGKTLRGQ